MIVAVAIVISTVYDSGTYSDFTVAKKNPGETFQIIGQLNKKREIKYDSTLQNQSLSFFLIDDKGVECQVLYYGSKPNDFRKLTMTVITGKMEGDVFIAAQVLTKCPSKYNNDSFSPGK